MTQVNQKTNFIVEPGKQEVIITRVFDAPRDLVFKAFTDPKLVEKWWGPESYTTIIDKMDAKKGGVWRFINRDAEGNDFAFNGVYHEVHSPERLVYTFEWEGMPGHVLLETITLEEFEGKTKMTDKSVYQSVEDRDGMVSMGMESGATDSMNQLAVLVEKS